MQAETRSRTHRFGVGLDGNALLNGGWGEPERGFVWSEGKAAALRIPAVAGIHTLSVSMWGYVPESITVQEVLIFADGLFKGLFIIKDKAVNQIVHEAAGAGGIELVFYIPTANSPKRAENSSDERCLGIALALLQIQTTPIPETR